MTVKALDPFENGLLQLEKNFVPTKHKVGVLNVLPGQKNEKDIYSNSAPPYAPSSLGLY